jgi:hypothetical protein
MSVCVCVPKYMHMSTKGLHTKREREGKTCKIHLRTVPHTAEIPKAVCWDNNGTCWIHVMYSRHIGLGMVDVG